MRVSMWIHLRFSCSKSKHFLNVLCCTCFSVTVLQVSQVWTYPLDLLLMVFTACELVDKACPESNEFESTNRPPICA